MKQVYIRAGKQGITQDVQVNVDDDGDVREL